MLLLPVLPYEYGSEQEIMVYCEDESYVPAFGLSSNNTRQFVQVTDTSYLDPFPGIAKNF